MKWDGFSLHIENLLPGLVVVGCLLLLAPADIQPDSTAALNSIANNTVIVGGFFFATSYLAGIILAAASRFLLDPLSQIAIRPWLFRSFDREAFGTASPLRIRDTYWHTVQTALSDGNDYQKSEIKYRRERARLLRSSIVPCLLFTSILFRNTALLLLIPGLIALFAATMILYSYLELTVYQEAKEPNEPQEQAIDDSSE